LFLCLCVCVLCICVFACAFVYCASACVCVSCTCVVISASAQLSNIDVVSIYSRVFLAELSGAVGYSVNFNTGVRVTQPSASAPASAASAAAAAAVDVPTNVQPALESIEQMQSMVFQAHKLGYKPGTHVVKKSGGEADLFKIDAYVSTNVKLVQQEFGKSIATLVITCDELLSDFRLHKGSVTELLPGYSFDLSPCCPLQSVAWKVEAAKSCVTLALQRTYGLMKMMGADLELCIKPTLVRVVSEWQPGELFIAPASMRIERKASPGSLVVGKFDLGSDSLEALYMMPHFVAPVLAKGEVSKTAWVAPFWHIPASSATVKPNMGLKAFEVMIQDVKVRVPILVNLKPLDAGTELTWDKSQAFILATRASYIAIL
jgi:hypothetical protein